MYSHFKVNGIYIQCYKILFSVIRELIIGSYIYINQETNMDLARTDMGGYMELAGIAVYLYHE